MRPNLGHLKNTTRANNTVSHGEILTLSHVDGLIFRIFFYLFITNEKTVCGIHHQYSTNLKAFKGKYLGKAAMKIHCIIWLL